MNRLLRERRDLAMLTQEELAERVGVSTLTVRRWERGQRPYPIHLRKLCEVFNASPAELGVEIRVPGADASGPATMDAEDDVNRREFLKAVTTVGAALAVVSKAMPPGLGRLGETEFDRIRLAVERATRLERASQYMAAQAVLPSVLADTERLVRQAPDDARPAARVLLSRTHALSAWVLIKQDRTAEALVAAGQAIDAARLAEDAVLVGAGLRCLGEAHMRAGQYGLACDLSVEAGELVGRSRTTDVADGLSIRGAAYLSAAMACARAGDAGAAHELLDAADSCAVELGQDVSGAAVFGPSNVAIHRVAVPMDLGDPGTALRWAETEPAQVPVGMEERRARYLIDVARAYVAHRRDADAAHALLRAESAAAEEVRGHRLTRSVLAELLGRERRGAIPGLRELADRCGASA